MALLAEVTEMEFARLRDLLDVSDSVLSKHLAILAEAGYLDLRKAKASGRQRTWVAATAAGRKALKQHLAALQAISAGATVPQR